MISFKKYIKPLEFHKIIIINKKLTTNIIWFESEEAINVIEFSFINGNWGKPEDWVKAGGGNVADVVVSGGGWIGGENILLFVATRPGMFESRPGTGIGAGGKGVLNCGVGMEPLAAAVETPKS